MSKENQGLKLMVQVDQATASCTASSYFLQTPLTSSMERLLQEFLKDILEHACTFTYNPAGAGGLREEQAIARSGITRCLTRCITLACS